METVDSITNDIVDKNPPRHSIKRTVITSLLGVFAFLIILAIGVEVGYIYPTYFHNKANSTTSVGSIDTQTSINDLTTVVPTLSTTIDSTLVFQKFDTNVPSQSNTTSITDALGNVLSSFTTKNSNSTFDMSFTNFNNYISYSSGLLSSNELYNNNQVTETTYSVYESNGKIDTVSSALKSLLNNNANPIQPFIINNTFLLGFNGSSSRDFEMTNLPTGKSKTLFTVSPIGSSLTNNAFFTPQDISPDGRIISFFVDDETVGKHSVNSPSIVVYNILRGTYNIETIPDSIIANNLGVLTESGAFKASWDGRFLIYPVTYQTSTGEAETLHLYSFTQKKDYVLQNNGANPVAGGHDVFFAPDNNHVLANNGGNPWGLYSTANGSVVKAFNFGSVDISQAQIIGWINNATLAYTVNAPLTAPGNETFYNPDSAYSFDITTGTTTKFPTGLGGLMAILPKSPSIGDVSIPTAIDTYTPTPSVQPTPPEATIPSVDESSWKTYTSTNDNATFKYPSDWSAVIPSIQSNSSTNTDQIALKSPSGAIQINWVTELSGFGGTCDPNISPDQGGCALVTVISKNAIPNASGLFLVAGTITRDQKTYQPFLAIQNADGLTTSQRTMGYDMFNINNANGGTLFSTSGTYAGGPSLSQQDAIAYLHKTDVQTAEEIFMSLHYKGN